MIGKELSHFTIVDKLGEGGMGIVYRACDNKLGREVALKVLPSDAVGDDERRMRFIREARSAASVSHPHIAAVHEINESEDGTVFIAMELVEGETLAERITRGPIPVRAAISCTIEIAEALDRAHASGVIHRDLKPENIVIGVDRHVKILDFGLAKLRDEHQRENFGRSGPQAKTRSLHVTRDGRVMGTASYMSPEQARGLDVDTRTDLFSLGVLLYEMVTGDKPFHGETVTDTLSAITRDTPRSPHDLDPNVPLELERIIYKCLEKNPDDRYQHADELVVDLRRLRREGDAQSTSISGSQPTPLASLPPSRPSLLRYVLPVLAAIGVFLVLAKVFVGGEATSAPPSAPSLAVMPLTHVAADEEAEPLGRILQELIITDLSGADSLRVLSSQRLQELRNQIAGGEPGRIDASNAGAVAERAGASTMLTGLLSRNGESWVLTAQLINVADGRVVASQRVDGADVYSMVDDLTSRIRTDLGVTAEAQVLRPVSEKAGAVEAYKHYFLGVDFLNRGQMSSAVEELEKAVEADPKFGQAYYKLAVARWWEAGDLLPRFGDAADANKPAEILESLLDGSIKMTHKDRRLAEGMLPLVRYEYEEATPIFERLVEEFPDEKEAWYGYGEARRHTPGAALDPVAQQAFRKALDLDPSFGIAYVHVREYFLATQDYEGAVAFVSRLADRTPDDWKWSLERALWQVRAGESDRGFATLDRVLPEMEDTERVDALSAVAYVIVAQHGDYERARELYRRALALGVEEREGALHRMAAWHEYQAGRPEVAEPLFRKALEKKPDDEQAYNGIFEIGLDQGRFREVLDEAARLARSDRALPVHYQYWLRAAFEIMDQPEIDAAIRRGLEQAEAPKDLVRLWLAVSNAAAEVDDHRQALDALDRAEQAGTAEEIPWTMGRRAWVLTQLRDIDGAEAQWARLLEHYPDTTEGLVGRAYLALDGGDGRRAAELATYVNGIEPSRFDAWMIRMAGTYLAEGAAAADAVHREALATIDGVRPLRWYLVRAADTFRGLGDDERALATARRALEVDPGSEEAEARAAVARALASSGRLDEAREQVREASRLEPGGIELALWPAAFDLLEGEADSAVRRLRELLAEGRRHQAVCRLMAYALSAAGSHDEAVTYARRAASMGNNRPTLDALAWALVNGGDLEEGIEVAQRSIALPPSFGQERLLPHHAPARHSLGLAYLQQGRTAEAIDALEQASRERPNRSRIREDLARARAGGGR